MEKELIKNKKLKGIFIFLIVVLFICNVFFALAKINAKDVIVEEILISENNKEIILIIDAGYFDENRNFVSNIYQDVKDLDGVWSKPIKNNEYVRIVFEKNLTHLNDITIYPNVVDGEPKIEVYEESGVDLIAEFSDLKNNEYNKIYLNNLKSESQNTFDLRVVGGIVEFDYIFDPPANDSSNNVYQCGTLDSPGVYTLNQSITGDDTCIIINSYNVTLNGQGNNLTFGLTMAGSEYGIFCSNFSNITINNMSIIRTPHAQLSTHGIYLNYTTNSTISNVEIRNGTHVRDNSLNTGSGIYMDYSSNITIDSVSSYFGSDGIYLKRSFNNYITNSIFNNNQGGIMLDSSSNNKISNVNLSNNYKNGIRFYTTFSYPSNNTITNASIFNNYRGLLYSADNLVNNTLYNSTISNNVFAKQGYATSSNQPISSSGNIFKDNLVSVIINSSMSYDGSYLSRTYDVNSNISLNFSILYVNNTIAKIFSYNITFYPSQSYTASNISNILQINFTPENSGIYTLKLNVTLDDTNDSEIRNFMFLIGNLSSDSKVYYMHADVPTHGQPLATGGYDSGSLFSYPTSTEEFRSCAGTVIYQPDKIANFYPIIQNVTIGWFYNATNLTSGDPWSTIQLFATINAGERDYNQSIPINDGDFWLNITNFNDLNITSDYAWRFYWLGIKLDGKHPKVISNDTQQSYVNLTYLYTGPKITYFGEQGAGSDIRNINILSSTFNDSTRDANFQFDGTGNFTLALSLVSSNYSIFYDNNLCPTENCTINTNSGGIINLTLSLGSLHELDIIFNDTASVITLIAPADLTNATTNAYNFTFNVTDTDNISSCNLIFDGVIINTLTSVNNTGGTMGMYNSSLSVGTHLWSVNCTDVAGNVKNSSIRTLTVESATTTTTDGGGGGGYPTFYPTNEELEQGYNKNLYANWKIRVNISGEFYTLTLNKVGSPNATFTISSIPSQTKVLSEGEEWEIELTGDNSYDLSVLLNSITGSAVNVTLKSISASVISSGEEEDVTLKSISASVISSGEEEELIDGEEEIKTDYLEEENLEEEKSYFWQIAGITVLIVLIAGIILFALHKRKVKFRKNPKI